MRDNEWRNLSVKIVVVLFSLCVLLFAFSFLSHEEITGKDLVENTNVPIGKTVFAGDVVLAENEMIKVPIVSNMHYLTQQIFDLDLKGILISLSTGTVPISTSSISTEGISSSGKAIGFEGPGYLTLEGENLVVKAPDQFVWAFNTPYKYLKKTDSGVDIYENNTKIGSINENDIKNQDFGNSYYNISDITRWYNYDAGEGSTYVLEKGLGNFSDNRSALSPTQVKEYFGEDVSNYSAGYPVNSPVMVYAVNFSEEVGENYATGLGSYPQYDNNIRAFNAAQFCEGWNGTIIPPNSYGTGRSYIDFGSVSDGEAPGGSAAHGVCPPARVLRAIALSEGFSMPVGLTSGEDAVLFGFSPTEGVKVYNNNDYPIQIIMWYEGSGTGMSLHGQIIRYVPN
ncbi:hypothetical protein LJC03_03550 [Methanobrevibacter sp. OttesenSCG-928-I08]|nr:hypothetical protein [Methanobrevibacter sp. OttesenSCG-928-I08]